MQSQLLPQASRFASLTGRVFVRVVAIQAVIWLAAPSTAVACSGGRLIPSGQTPMPTMSFTGTAVRVEVPGIGSLTSGGADLEWTFVLDDGATADPARRVTVTSAVDSAACGFEFELGHRYRVSAVLVPDQWLPNVAVGEAVEAVRLADPPAVEGRHPTLLSRVVAFVPLLVALAAVLAAIQILVRSRRS